MPFCDWFSGFVNLDMPQFHNGWFCEVTRSKVLAYQTSKPLIVEGSYSDKVLVKSVKQTFCPTGGASQKYLDSLVGKDTSSYRVYISGNPTKFLQGHNVYGHSDICSIIMDFLYQVLKVLEVDEFTIRRVLNREPIFITRLDITSSYIMDSAADVGGWLRAASQYMTGKNQKVDNEKTLYVGKHSRRVSIKVYEKASEMVAHRKTFNLSDEIFDRLHLVASKLLRFEVTLRGMKLKDLRFDLLHDLTNDKLEREFQTVISKMNLPENIELVENAVHELPLRYSGVYLRWQDGVILRDTMSKAQYYRYRKFFLERFNLDLSMPPRDISHTNVVPLWRVICPGAEYNPSEDDELLYKPFSNMKINE
jgi:II/X family phage/plasmid replication protein